MESLVARTLLLQQAEEFENIVVKATADGQVLRLKDVARIELGAQSYTVNTYTNGHPATVMIIFQTPGSNATEIIGNIKSLIKDTEKELPEGLKFDVQMDTSDFLYASINKVLSTLLEAFILVVLGTYWVLTAWPSGPRLAASRRIMQARSTEGTALVKPW